MKALEDIQEDFVLDPFRNRKPVEILPSRTDVHVGRGPRDQPCGTILDPLQAR